MHVRRWSVATGVILILAVTPVSAAVVPSVQEKDFSVVASLVLMTKFERLFTSNLVRQAKLTDAIANRLALTAATQAATNANAATATLKKFDHESAMLQTLVAKLQSSADATSASTAVELLKDRAVQAATLDTRVSATLTAEQTKVVKQLATSLAAETDNAQRSGIVTQVVNSFAGIHDDTATQVAKKLELTAKLDEATDDADLETDLDVEEATTLSLVPRLTPDQVALVTASVQSNLPAAHQLIVLSELLPKVPAGAQPALQTAIDAIAKHLAALSPTSSDIQQVLKDSERSAELQSQVIDRLKEHADPATRHQLEVLTQQAEQQREATKQAAEITKKVQEQQTEAAKQAQEQSIEAANKQAEQQKESNARSQSGSAMNSPASSTTTGDHGAPTTSSASSNRMDTESGRSLSTPDSQSSADREILTIKVKDGQFDGDTTFSLKSGTIVTVQFENDDPTARTLSLSSGATSGAISNTRTSLPSFMITAPVTFSVTGIARSGSILLN